MLEIDRGDVCRNIGEKLKALVEQTGIANMQRKMTALEMDYVKKTKDRERYLKTAGRFYELTEIVEQENRSMIVNMLYLRKSLERARERCRKLEEDAAELTEKSERDPLTGLANRYRLTNDSERSWNSALRNINRCRLRFWILIILSSTTTVTDIRRGMTVCVPSRH